MNDSHQIQNPGLSPSPGSPRVPPRHLIAGAVALALTAGAPAAQFIQPGDVILSAGGQTFKDDRDLPKRVAAARASMRSNRSAPPTPTLPHKGGGG